LVKLNNKFFVRWRPFSWQKKFGEIDHLIRRTRYDTYSICSQFHQCYTSAFFVQIFQQSQNVTRKTMFVRKICTYNVDEIDTWIGNLSLF